MAIGLLLAFALDAFLTHGLRRMPQWNPAVWSTMARGETNADLVIIGSSRALVHFDCETISEITHASCVNLGVNASRPNIQSPVLELYLQRNRAPRLIVISADIATLASATDFNQSEFLPHLDEPILFNAFARIKPELYADRYLPLYALSQLGTPALLDSLHGWLGRTGEPERRPTGWSPMNLTWDGNLEAFIKENPQGKDFDRTDEGAAQLAALLERARASGAKVVVAYPPELAEWVPFATNRAEILAELRAITAAKGAAYLDYTASPLTRSRENFYNSTHLNADAARRFSADFARDISVLLRRE
ncbi:MAG: hypothetical protein ABI193_11200 [Minicystis sp.]